MTAGLWTRASNYYKRNSARLLYKDTFVVRTSTPLISFTFDDFPRSAFTVGAEILAECGAAGTYYVCLGLLGNDSPSGSLCTAEDLRALLASGHELGCHTYSHCHSWDTRPEVFEESVLKNRAALETLIPTMKFESFSYPLAEPRPLTKRRTAPHFRCCRVGGQKFNAGKADLAGLAAYFLEQSRGDLQAVKDMIDCNRAARGWLIFATHDIADRPSRYGCTPEFFRAVVRYSVSSGAAILPVTSALKLLQGGSI